jgi:hypothetical protein
MQNGERRSLTACAGSSLEDLRSLFNLPAFERRANHCYELRLTSRCVPGSQVCSGRAGGDDCQSNARSTISCICRNHQREVKGDGGRLLLNRLLRRGLPRLSSNCVSVIVCISVFAPSLGVRIGQIRSDPYKYGYTGIFRIIPNIDSSQTWATVTLPCAERCLATSTTS